VTIPGCRPGRSGDRHGARAGRDDVGCPLGPAPFRGSPAPVAAAAGHRPTAPASCSPRARRRSCQGRARSVSCRSRRWQLRAPLPASPLGPCARAPAATRSSPMLGPAGPPQPDPGLPRPPRRTQNRTRNPPLPQTLRSPQHLPPHGDSRQDLTTHERHLQPNRQRSPGPRHGVALEGRTGVAWGRVDRIGLGRFARGIQDRSTRTTSGNVRRIASHRDGRH
jgi:hypothetical protein